MLCLMEKFHGTISDDCRAFIYYLLQNFRVFIIVFSVNFTCGEVNISYHTRSSESDAMVKLSLTLLLLTTHTLKKVTSAEPPISTGFS